MTDAAMPQTSSGEQAYATADLIVNAIFRTEKVQNNESSNLLMSLYRERLWNIHKVGRVNMGLMQTNELG